MQADRSADGVAANPFAPKCVEGAFPELHAEGVPEKLAHSGDTPRVSSR
jgi:hypothetical protein